MMLRNFTLPDLQQKLDALVEGSLMEIGRRDYERLFGSDDAAAARLRNFARSHSCVISHHDGGISFRKELVKLSGGAQS